MQTDNMTSPLCVPFIHYVPKREEMSGGWRRLNNEKLHYFYTSQNSIRVIISRMRWAEHVAHTEEIRNP